MTFSFRSRLCCKFTEWKKKMCLDKAHHLVVVSIAAATFRFPRLNHRARLFLSWCLWKRNNFYSKHIVRALDTIHFATWERVGDEAEETGRMSCLTTLPYVRDDIKPQCIKFLHVWKMLNFFHRWIFSNVFVQIYYLFIIPLLLLIPKYHFKFICFRIKNV